MTFLLDSANPRLECHTRFELRSAKIGPNYTEYRDSVAMGHEPQIEY
jgi:hypothetical protein